MEHQHIVLTKALLFETSPEQQHMHFAQGAPPPFETIAKLGFGAHAHVDKVMSTTSQRVFARKMFRRHRTVDKDAIKSFFVELQVLKKVKHYHCVELVRDSFLWST